MKQNIKKWKLNLKGLTVLTEAASGNYIYTPLIAALAGAKVLAFTKDSSYGKASQVEKDTLSLAKKLGVSKQIQVFKDKLPPAVISQADIVTNSGFLRPINKKFISCLKKTAVIPLMWETWELREKELDLRTLWQKGIPVLGTNENHPQLRILNYLGPLVLKKITEQGIKKILGLKVVVLAENGFGPYIKKTLKEKGAKVFSAVKDLKDAQVLVVAFHKAKKTVIGRKGIISTKKLKALAPHILVVQLTGTGVVVRKDLNEAGISYIPKKTPRPYFMSWTFADLGPEPVIKLHTAGLKAGEALAKARLRGLNREAAEKEALKSSPSQDFSRAQKIKYGSEKK